MKWISQIEYPHYILLPMPLKCCLKNVMKNKTDNEITDFTVYPLEGFWKKVNGEELDKINWNTH